MIKKVIKRCIILMLCIVMTAGLLGCNLSVNNGKRIVRIAIAQSETHPEYLGLVAFKEYVEERLGDKYEVQIFPNELLGSIQKTIELTQTGAIDFAVAGTANLETFADVYEVFSMPYLFDSIESYKAVMQDTDYMENIYESTDSSGFRVLTWYNAGTRNFYGKKAINTPADLSGMKIRVQQSPASVAMMQAFGAAASPMSFGEVYTAIQQGVIDGAENNELALTNNKHGEVAKYYTYNMHQIIPDMLVGNLKFIQGLDEEELQPLVDSWRAANPNIVRFWWEVDRCVKETVKKRVPTETHGIRFIYQSGMLFIKLPSGRQLSYVKPRMGENRFGGESVTYEGVGGTKKWERIESYGPKFVENIVQAISRDILAHSMRTLSHCFICGHVHDELIIECSMGVSLDAICEQMGRTPAWIPGLLLRADGYECSFYKKD